MGKGLKIRYESAKLSYLLMNVLSFILLDLFYLYLGVEYLKPLIRGINYRHF